MNQYLLFNCLLFWASMASATTAIPTFPATWKKAKPKLLRPCRLLISAHIGTVDRRRRQLFPGIDTRIHWDNPEEGWIGGKREAEDEGEKEDVRQMLNNLLKNSHSYYDCCCMGGRQAVGDGRGGGCFASGHGSQSEDALVGANHVAVEDARLEVAHRLLSLGVPHNQVQ
ncbi:uncharacterized protein LOC116246135 [Nymphaea colorata]|uniref:uncharacterized protein LOC116246135 n=1 Tax=Nymphaea colorata TaxID=210225 RepID=UPI00129D5E24|nr:uncharacterized protein LOC116246135 [Nymphaea colorata]XP_049931522.1 uncharacterized protein LOC116246135 [Nymphaea colorata]